MNVGASRINHYLKRISREEREAALRPRKHYGSNKQQQSTFLFFPSCSKSHDCALATEERGSVCHWTEEQSAECVRKSGLDDAILKHVSQQSLSQRANKVISLKIAQAFLERLRFYDSVEAANILN